MRPGLSKLAFKAPASYPTHETAAGREDITNFGIRKHRRFVAVRCWFVAALVLGGWNPAGRAQPAPGDGKPLFTIANRRLSSSPVVISYGDMRFTDPKDTVVTNPKVRRWLVGRIAAEKPDALLLSGDVPMRGGIAGDYAVFDSETAPWRSAGLVVIPALGNHEMYREGREVCRDNQPVCLENWWKAFPKLQGVRWYSVQLGGKMFVLNLDSNAPLLPGSDQAKWIQRQLAGLPRSVRFVFLNMHHPPVADPSPETGPEASPRPNEAALAALLKTAPVRKRVRFIVTAAHVHNYERFLRDGIVYLVSGGGGAKPSAVQRGADDLYRDSSEPNYHYLKFVLLEDRIEAEMIRVADPLADVPRWEVKDRFQVK